MTFFEKHVKVFISLLLFQGRCQNLEDNFAAMSNHKNNFSLSLFAIPILPCSSALRIWKGRPSLTLLHDICQAESQLSCEHITRGQRGGGPGLRSSLLPSWVWLSLPSPAHKALCWQMRPLIKVYINPQPSTTCPVSHIKPEILHNFISSIYLNNDVCMCQIAIVNSIMSCDFSPLFVPLLNSNGQRPSFLTVGNIRVPRCQLVENIWFHWVPKQDS